MSYYNSISNKFNRFLLLLISVAPFAGFILHKVTSKDFSTTLTFASYFGVALILLHSSQKKSIKFPLYLWFYLFFVLYIFYSTFYQLDRDFKIKYLMTNREIGAFNFMFILENIALKKAYFNRIIKYSKAILIIAIFVIIIQEVHDKNFLIRPDLTATKFDLTASTEDRLGSIYTWVGANGVGYGFVPILIIVVEILARQKKKIGLWIIFGIIFAILSKGRWVMINAFLVFFILIINKKEKLNKILKYSIIIPLIGIGTYVALNSVGINAKGIVENRILESGERSDKKSASTRLLAINVFNKLYWKNAVFGVGNRKYGMGGTGHHNYELSKLLGGKSSQIHVGYLMLFYMYGFIGGSLFICFLFLITRKLYRDAKITTYWGPFLGFLGFAISNLTLVHFSVYEMGLLLALLTNQYYIKRHNEQLSLKRSYS